MRVALGGFMGAGKSTVGRALAGRLGVDFVDMDRVLEDRFGPIPEQFSRDGEAAFRERERELVRILCGDDDPRVLATGGGVWADRENRALLRQSYRTLTLVAPFEVLARRVGAGEDRPVWDADARRRYAERERAYEQADRVMDTSDRSVTSIVEEVLAWLG